MRPNPMNKKTTKQNLNVGLDRDLYLKLKATIVANDQTITKVLRRLIVTYLINNGRL